MHIHIHAYIDTHTHTTNVHTENLKMAKDLEQFMVSNESNVSLYTFCTD